MAGTGTVFQAVFEPLSAVALALFLGLGSGSESVEAPALWGVPPEALGSQRILRLNYQDQERDGTLKLVLRIADEHRYTLLGSDQFNRSWFRIVADGERALVLDVRDKSYCDYEGAIELEQVPLGPLPFDALPALLLGRLPLEPSSLSTSEEGAWTFLDRDRRRWTARTEDGTLASWTLWNEREEPEVYWQQAGRLSLLSSRSQGLQLRWRSGKPEPLTQELDGLDPPADYQRWCPEPPRSEAGAGGRL